MQELLRLAEPERGKLVVQRRQAGHLTFLHSLRCAWRDDMYLTFQQPFAMSLRLLEGEQRYGSSRFRLDLGIVRFDEQLRFGANIWLENDAWDGFVSRLARLEAGEAVLQDMSDEFRLRFGQGSGQAYLGIEAAARHVATPDVSLSVRADDVGRDTMEYVRRAFLECRPWWS